MNLIAFVLLAVVSLCHSNVLPEEHNINRRAASDDLKFITRFAWKLFKNSKLDQTESNHVMSPISAHLCLAMLQPTAAGETKRQFDELLGSHDPQVISDAINGMQATRSRNELHSATAMFTTIKYTLNETFAANARQSVVKVVPVDFSQFDPTEKTINSWVSEATEGQISSVIDPEEDIHDYKLMLANAIYFRGFWKKDFDKETEEGDFATKSTESMKVTYMKMHEGLKYGQKSLGANNLGYRWIELPYDQDEYAMFIVMPTERWGLEKMIQAMTENNLADMMSRDLKTGQWVWALVNLKLPKFGVKSKISLVNTLQEVSTFQFSN